MTTTLSSALHSNPKAYIGTKIALVEHDISTLDKLPSKYQNVTTLFLSNNYISSLDNIQQFPNLKVLSLANNSITTFSQLSQLSSLSCLKVLNLEFNPVTRLPFYRSHILLLSPSLTMLDSVNITPSDHSLSTTAIKSESTSRGLLTSNTALIWRLEGILTRQDVHRELCSYISGRVASLNAYTLSLSPPKPLKLKLIFSCLEDLSEYVDQSKIDDDVIQSFKSLINKKRSKSRSLADVNLIWSRAFATKITDQNLKISSLLNSIDQIYSKMIESFSPYLEGIKSVEELRSLAQSRQMEMERDRDRYVEELKSIVMTPTRRKMPEPNLSHGLELIPTTTATSPSRHQSISIETQAIDLERTYLNDLGEFLSSCLTEMTSSPQKDHIILPSAPSSSSLIPISQFSKVISSWWNALLAMDCIPDDLSLSFLLSKMPIGSTNQKEIMLSQYQLHQESRRLSENFNRKLLLKRGFELFVTNRNSTISKLSELNLIFDRSITSFDYSRLSKTWNTWRFLSYCNFCCSTFLKYSQSNLIRNIFDFWTIQFYKKKGLESLFNIYLERNNLLSRGFYLLAKNASLNKLENQSKLNQMAVDVDQNRLKLLIFDRIFRANHLRVSQANSLCDHVIIMKNFDLQRDFFRLFRAHFNYRHVIKSRIVKICFDFWTKHFALKNSCNFNLLSSYLNSWKFSHGHVIGQNATSQHVYTQNLVKNFYCHWKNSVKNLQSMEVLPQSIKIMTLSRFFSLWHRNYLISTMNSSFKTECLDSPFATSSQLIRTDIATPSIISDWLPHVDSMMRSRVVTSSPAKLKYNCKKLPDLSFEIERLQSKIFNRLR
ncbi:hypothetical protein RCL1_004835 [Eukaryota sp. TZLM3-RCL]